MANFTSCYGGWQRRVGAWWSNGSMIGLNCDDFNGLGHLILGIEVNARGVLTLLNERFYPQELLCRVLPLRAIERFLDHAALLWVLQPLGHGINIPKSVNSLHLPNQDHCLVEGGRPSSTGNLHHSLAYKEKSSKSDEWLLGAHDHLLLLKQGYLENKLSKEAVGVRGIHEVAEHFIEPESRRKLHVEVKSMQNSKFHIIDCFGTHIGVLSKETEHVNSLGSDLLELTSNQETCDSNQL